MRRLLRVRDLSSKDSGTPEEAEKTYRGGFDDDPFAGDEGIVILARDGAELDVASASHAIGGVADAPGEVEYVRGNGDDLHSDLGRRVGFRVYD